MQKIKLLILMTILSGNIYASDIDIITGLVIDKGLSDIKENCTICHTGRFIVINGGDRKFWSEKITAMQEGFGLWKLKEGQREKILNYLSKNYSKAINISINE